MMKQCMKFETSEQQREIKSTRIKVDSPEQNIKKNKQNKNPKYTPHISHFYGAVCYHILENMKFYSLQISYIVLYFHPIHHFNYKIRNVNVVMCHSECMCVCVRVWQKLQLNSKSTNSIVYSHCILTVAGVVGITLWKIINCMKMLERRWHSGKRHW